VTDRRYGFVALGASAVSSRHEAIPPVGHPHG